jgi:hypothetical protein
MIGCWANQGLSETVRLEFLLRSMRNTLDIAERPHLRFDSQGHRNSGTGSPFVEEFKLILQITTY